MNDPQSVAPGSLTSSACDLAFDAAQDGLILVDQSGHVQRSNAAAEAILGTRLDDIASIDCVFGALNRRYLAHALSRGASQFETELQRGTYVDVRLSLVERSPVLILYAIRDATALCRARAKQRRMAVHLAEKRRVEELGELIGGIAHDFNNLLMPILGNSELLGNSESEEVRELSDDIRVAATQAAQLVDNIRILNRQNTDEAFVNVASALGQCQQLIANSPAFHVHWNCDVDSSLCAIMLPADFNRIVLNLVKNARDACDEAGRCDVVSKVSDVDGELVLVLEVRDNGPGIPASIRHRIFDLYFTTKTRDRGTGLGLATARALLQDAGGSLDAASDSTGSCFTVRVPVRASAQAKAAIPKVTSLIDQRILLVDDDTLVLRAFKRILSRAGATITAESTPEKALGRVQSSESFDLVMTDYLMPGMTGLQLAKAVGDLSPLLPIVICSGQICSREDQEDLRQYSRLVLAKPISGSSLVERLTGVLREHPKNELCPK